MIDKEAINQLAMATAIAQATDAVFKALAPNPDTGSSAGFAALPKDFQVHDLERFMANRRNLRGLMSTTSLAAFVEYVKRHGSGYSSEAFVDPDAMDAMAVLDKGPTHNPGHCAHRAKLSLMPTAAFNAVRSADGTRMGQRAMAEFLEDWSDIITCFQGSERIPNAKAISAIRRITIESAKKVETTEGSLSSERSAFESVAATSVEPIPEFIYFKLKPYFELAERVFAMRLRIYPGDKEVSLSLKLINLELHKEEMATELVGILQDAQLGCSLYVGEFDA
jgi:uncharacterized protein YfdQ (DUF2303 family)